MFEKLVNKSKSKSTTSPNLEATTEFVTFVVSQGYRLAYSTLALAAKELGENDSNQKPGQRGGGLAAKLPKALQPFICRADGGYKKGTESKWDEVPEGLRDMDPIPAAKAVEAVNLWREALAAEAEEEAAS